MLGVLFVVVAVNLFLYFGYYSPEPTTPLPAKHSSGPSTTIERTERTEPKEETRPVTTPQSTSATANATTNATASATATANATSSAYP